MIGFSYGYLGWALIGEISGETWEKKRTVKAKGNMSLKRIGFGCKVLRANQETESTQWIALRVCFLWSSLKSDSP